MANFQQRTRASTGTHVDVEHIGGDDFASVTVFWGAQTKQLRVDADTLESMASAMMIAAGRIRKDEK